MTGKKTNKQATPRKSRQSLVFEELEPRLLLSADLPIDLPAVLAPDRGDDEPVSIYEEITAAAATEEQSETRELVFVDTDTPDYQTLIDDLIGNGGEDRSIEFVLLDNSNDGIAQITDTLSQYRDLEAVHIISHGSEGFIDLGGSRLEFDTLLANSTAIQGWANALSENGDLLIYGCNLAASEDGQALVDSLARLTGADVAASDDLTGSEARGGDWELEQTTGRVETTVVFSANLKQNWAATLAAPNADAGGPYTISEGDNLILDGSASSDADSDPLTYAWDVDGDGAYDDATGATPTLTWAQLQALDIPVNDDGSYTIGLRADDGNGGISTTTATLTVTNTAPTLTVSGNAQVDVGQTYTLNLGASDPGDDSITSWTINWGDGSIETIAGNPASVTHVFSNAGLTNNITVSAMDEDGVFYNSALLIANAATGSDGFIIRYGYDPATGQADWVNRQIINTTTASDLDWAVDVIVAPDGFMYATGYDSRNIVRFDATTGEQDLSFEITTAQHFVSIDFGPDGLLYAASDSGWVKSYDINDPGTVVNTWTLGYTPEEMAFGADGFLYVGDYVSSGNIYKHDLADANWADDTVFASPPDGAGVRTEQFAFGPDGNLYVARSSGDILKYDLSGTSPVGSIFASPGTSGAGHPNGPTGLAFGPDGKLYLTRVNTVLRYDITDSAPASPEVYVSTSGGLNNPWFTTFTPNQQVYVNDHPQPVVDAFSVDEDSVLSDDVSTNDTLGVRGGTYTVEVGDEASNGVVVMNTDGSFTYTPTGNFNGADSFTYTVTDSDGDSATATVSLTVNPINDAPTAADNTVTTNEDTAYVFTLADFGFSDVDGDSLGQIQITTLEGAGSLQLSGADVVLNQVITAADITAGNLTFTPAADANGAGYDSFAFRVQDGTAYSAAPYAITVDVTAVNDAPIHSVPAAQNTSGTTPLIFSNTNGNGITVADPDASGAPVEVTLSASNGTLNLAGTSGLSFSAGDGSSNAAMTFTGTAADINTALNGLSFQPDAGYQGMAAVQIITDDLGNAGTGGALNALDNVNITVTASAPTANAQDTLPPLDELILEDSLDLLAQAPVSTPVNRVNVGPAAEQALDAASPAAEPATAPASNPAVDVMPGSGRGVPTQADVSLPGMVPLFDQNVQSQDEDRPSTVRLISSVIRQGLVDPFTYAKMLNPLQPDMAIWESIEAMMEQMDGRDTSWYSDDQVLTTTTTTGLTVSFTVGYVSWLLRAGYLSASLMSVLPLWREFDPLPVLAATTKKKKRKSADDGKDSPQTNDIESEGIFSSNETV